MAAPSIEEIAFEMHLDPDTHPGGWRRRKPGFVSRLTEAWLVLIGKHSLHRAYQKGYDDHIRHDSAQRAAETLMKRYEYAKAMQNSVDPIGVIPNFNGSRF